MKSLQLPYWFEARFAPTIGILSMQCAKDDSQVINWLLARGEMQPT